MHTHARRPLARPKYTFCQIAGTSELCWKLLWRQLHLCNVMMGKMKLPFKEKAYIPKEKLTDYILSESHPVGSSKAKFFRGLGFDETNVGQLTKSILRIAKTNDVKDVRKFSYGTNYIVEGSIETPIGKTVIITTVWFAQTEKNRPRFVTAYPV